MANERFELKRHPGVFVDLRKYRERWQYRCPTVPSFSVWTNTNTGDRAAAEINAAENVGYVIRVTQEKQSSAERHIKSLLPSIGAQYASELRRELVQMMQGRYLNCVETIFREHALTSVEKSLAGVLLQRKMVESQTEFLKELEAKHTALCEGRKAAAAKVREGKVEAVTEQLQQLRGEF